MVTMDADDKGAFIWVSQLGFEESLHYKLVALVEGERPDQYVLCVESSYLRIKVWICRPLIR